MINLKEINGGIVMILLGVIVLGMFCYLGYALLNPEKF